MSPEREFTALADLHRRTGERLAAMHDEFGFTQQDLDVFTMPVAPEPGQIPTEFQVDFTTDSGMRRVLFTVPADLADELIERFGAYLERKAA